MPEKDGAEPKTMTIGTSNVFEVGCGILYIIILYCLTELHCRYPFILDEISLT